MLVAFLKGSNASTTSMYPTPLQHSQLPPSHAFQNTFKSSDHLLDQWFPKCALGAIGNGFLTEAPRNIMQFS
jgi:hypothetical protein